MRQTNFVIFKSDSRYSITEFGSSGVKQAFLSEGNVSGNESVLLRLSQIKPESETIESFVEKYSGHLLFA
jgi:hypothetical protein